MLNRSLSCSQSGQTSLIGMSPLTLQLDMENNVHEIIYFVYLAYVKGTFLNDAHFESTSTSVSLAV